MPSSATPVASGIVARLLATGLSALTALLLVATPALAATLSVTSTADSGAGSLRQAIADATSGDTITFNLPGPSTITLASQIDVTKRVIVQGSADDPSAVRLTAAAGNRVFDVASGGSLDLRWVTVQDASLPGGDGGAIRSQGLLGVEGVVFTGNSATSGGAIWASGETAVLRAVFTGNTADNADPNQVVGGSAITTSGILTVQESTFSDNVSMGAGVGTIRSTGQLSMWNSAFQDNVATSGGSAVWGSGITYLESSTASGGVGSAIVSRSFQFVASGVTLRNNTAVNGAGVRVEPLGAITVYGSTLAGNTADQLGGAAYASDWNSQLTVRDSTLSGNAAGTAGGGIFARGAAEITNATIANNTAVGGPGGLAVATNYVTLSNTLLADNDGGDCDYLEGASTLAADDHNLVRDYGCYTGNTSRADGDPELETLADNGGTTETIAIGPAGAAADAGNNDTCLETDQRNVARPRSAVNACDIGAFEASGVPVLDLDPVTILGGYVDACARHLQPGSMVTFSVDFGITEITDTVEVGTDGRACGDLVTPDDVAPGTYPVSAVGVDTDGSPAELLGEVEISAVIVTVTPGVVSAAQEFRLCATGFEPLSSVGIWLVPGTSGQWERGDEVWQLGGTADATGRVCGSYSASLDMFTVLPGTYTLIVSGIDPHDFAIRGEVTLIVELPATDTGPVVGTTRVARGEMPVWGSLLLVLTGLATLLGWSPLRRRHRRPGA